MVLVLACAVMGLVVPLVLIKVFGFGQRILAEDQLPPAEVAVVEPPAATIQRDLSAIPPSEPKIPANPAYDDGVFCTGVMILGERIIVTLSDGSQLTQAHPSLEQVHRGSHVVIAGRRVPIKPRLRASEGQVASGPSGGPESPFPGGSGSRPKPSRRVIDPPIIITAAVDPKLPKSSGIPDPMIGRMRAALSAGELSIAEEVRRAMTDKIHR